MGSWFVPHIDNRIRLYVRTKFVCACVNELPYVVSVYDIQTLCVCFVR